MVCSVFLLSVFSAQAGALGPGLSGGGKGGLPLSATTRTVGCLEAFECGARANGGTPKPPSPRQVLLDQFKCDFTWECLKPDTNGAWSLSKGCSASRDGPRARGSGPKEQHSNTS